MNTHPPKTEETQGEELVRMTWHTIFIIAATSFLLGGIFLLFGAAIFVLNKI